VEQRIEQILQQAARDIELEFRSVMSQREQSLYERLNTLGVQVKALQEQDHGTMRKNGHHEYVSDREFADEVIIDTDLFLERNCSECAGGSGLDEAAEERFGDLLATSEHKHSRVQQPSIGAAATGTSFHDEEDSTMGASTDLAHSQHLRAKFQTSGRRTSHAYKLLPEWQENFEETDMDEGQFARYQYHAAFSVMLNKADDSTKNVTAASALTRDTWVLEPKAKTRIVWDVLAAIFLAYDLCLIPMGVFDMNRRGFLFVMSVLVMFYWSLDIVANFLVGYQLRDGEVEMRFLAIVRRYLKTWFFVDCVIVGLDWMTYGPALATGGSGEYGIEGAGLVRVGKVARFVRTLRVVRLIRFGKLRVIVTRIHDGLGHESTSIVFSIWRNLLLILVVNHFLACAWYWLGTLDSRHGWLATRSSGNGLSDDWLDHYLVSLYWSIANFTPGSSGVQPSTTEEYAFNVVVLFFGLVVFSVFVSSTTSLISRLVLMQSSKNKQMWVLRGFLRQHKFKPELRDRVLRYVKTALGVQKSLIHRNDVELLGLLSEPLREEVQLSLHLTTLGGHPLFKLLSVASMAFMRKMSVDALGETPYSRGDNIFSVGEHLEKMCFIVSGILRYTITHQGTEEAVQAGESTTRLLRSQDSFCEAILWTRWHSKGTMEADADCAILEIRGAAFRKNVIRHHMVGSIVQHYAKAFIQALNWTNDVTLNERLSDCQSSILTSGPIVEFLAQPWVQQVTAAKNSQRERVSGGDLG